MDKVWIIIVVSDARGRRKATVEQWTRGVSLPRPAGGVYYVGPFETREEALAARL